MSHKVNFEGQNIALKVKWQILIYFSFPLIPYVNLILFKLYKMEKSKNYILGTVYSLVVKCENLTLKFAKINLCTKKKDVFIVY